jgi:alpha-tubulin suppressor-like RCC1 family protein
MCRCCSSGYFITDPKSRSFEKCEDLANSYSVAQPLCKYECSWPKNSNWSAVLQGYNEPFHPGIELSSEASYRRDGRFVCSAVKVAAGGSHTCVLYGERDCGDSNFGLVVCYGSNLHGQLDVPQNATVPLPFLDVPAGLLHTCGITFASTLLCWGDNRFGQGDVPAGAFSNVSAGAYHSCAITAAGQLACWGNSSYGQAQSHADLVAAGRIAPGARFVSITSGAAHSCGVALVPGRTLLALSGDADSDTGGEVVCWGAD